MPRPALSRSASAGPGVAPADEAVSRVFREEAARVTGVVVRMLGDFGAAEEVVGDALLIAVQRWRRDGIPARPAAWLTMTAKRRAIDRLRRDAARNRKLAGLDREVEVSEPEPDDRLRLIFTCCHPALGRDAQVCLTLQSVLGFTTADIAAAFVVSESAVAQRLSRARRKITSARIPYRAPRDDELAERLSTVLAVLYLLFNEGYLSSRGNATQRRDLAEDAAWLGQMLVDLMPMEPEPLGLLALMRLHLARSGARFDRAGHIVLLRDQDRSRWDHPAIREAVRMIERAGSMRRPGPYQVQAAIAACHAEATTWEATDWVQILLLYDVLVDMTPTPIARLNRAIALREVVGPVAALAEIDTLAGDLQRYHLFHATRAELLREVGAGEAERAEAAAALELTRNPAERWLLESRLAH